MKIELCRTLFLSVLDRFCLRSHVCILQFHWSWQGFTDAAEQTVFYNSLVTSADILSDNEL